MTPERLHKILAARGVASRRASEEIIASGRVTVDGQIVREVGTKVSPDADIRVDGRPLRQPHKVYFILNKPRGYVTTLSDEKGRKSIGDLVRMLRTRVYPVGRLDAETEGLLLVTNDGELTNILTHPRFMAEKTYLVTVSGRLEAEALQRLRAGIHLREGKVAARVRVLRATRAATRMELTVSQGYNRQVRRMCAAVGHEVKRLERVRFGPLRLRGVSRGELRALTREETEGLLEFAGRKAQAASDSKAPDRKGEAHVGRKRRS